MSEEMTPDDSAPTPYGIAIAALLHIEDICEDIHDADVSDILGIARMSREAASKLNVERIVEQVQAEPEAAKVIIVECEGRPARLFAATGWEVLAGDGNDAGDLVLAVDGDEWVAQIGARHWDSVCKAEAILPADLYARHGKKLAIALDALREMREQGDEAASEALAQIADVDL